MHVSATRATRHTYKHSSATIGGCLKYVSMCGQLGYIYLYVGVSKHIFTQARFYICHFAPAFVGDLERENVFLVGVKRDCEKAAIGLGRSMI